MNDDYLKINKESWNRNVEYHLKSDFYAQEAFMNGENSLNSIELDILGDINGKKILHLQCHFGQDSISLARMGAIVTAMDLSDEAIKVARSINDDLGLDVNFICCDVYDLKNHLEEKFDIIFTSYGVIGWLPDINKWSALVHHFLVPKGKLLLVEFHPAVWMYDDAFEKVEYSYFNEGLIEEDFEGTYADKSAPIKNKYISWNHDLSEVMMGIINNGMEIKLFNEYNYSPYNCFLAMEKLDKKKYQIKKFADKFPLIYAMLAEKN